MISEDTYHIAIFNNIILLENDTHSKTEYHEFIFHKKLLQAM